MKNKTLWVGLVVAVLLAASAAPAQERPKPEPKPVTPLKVQVVFSDYEGEKKVGNLPYTLIVNADDVDYWTNLRVGLRVPVTTLDRESRPVMQYMNVGTDVDCRAATLAPGQYKLELRLRRSFMSPPPPPTGTRIGESNPILSQFEQGMNLLVRDGQPVVAASATDPVTGRVLRLEVTATAVK